MQLRFSIRDLLLVTAIIALAAGWWIDHQRISRLAVQQWDYKTFHWRFDDQPLKDFGTEGWDAFAASPVSDANGPQGMMVILKRPK